MRSAERGETRGVYTLDVRFKPLAGLTSDMMVWLFRNLHKDAIYPRTNETFPMYLLFHPVTGVKCQMKMLLFASWHQQASARAHACADRRSMLLPAHQSGRPLTPRGDRASAGWQHVHVE